MKRSAVSAAALGAVAGPFAGLTQGSTGRFKFAAANGGYGPLGPVAEIDTGEVLLHLPAGFSYRLLSRIGKQMTDGYPTPARSDGMAAFRPRRFDPTTLLVRNHEILFEVPHIGPAGTAYDKRSGGGTTTLHVDVNRRLIRDWISLNGTNANCAGGPTPWGSWITCEETTNGPDANKTFIGTTINLEQKHGYLFEVPTGERLPRIEKREPIRSAGRFAHEAVAVDPASGIVYQTEDDFAYASGFYRYIAPVNPLEARHLTDGGRLQILGVGNGVSVDLSRNQTVGATYAVDWIDIEDPDPTFPQGIANDPAARVVFQEGEAKGAAKFSRLEGIDYYDGRIYFVSTQGGGPPFAGRPASGGFGDGWGQVWVYDIAAETLTLLYESPSQRTLDMPDNITISPREKSVLLCEDSSGENFLRGLTQEGLLFDFALNAYPGQTSDEFAGATFSPDGKTLFVNLQATGVTFAIWGHWERGEL